MQIADRPTLIDGHWYKEGEALPDMGTLVAVSINGDIRNYEGLSRDVDKLPIYDDLGTGSSALFYDTKEMYKYEKKSQKWYKL